MSRGSAVITRTLLEAYASYGFAMFPCAHRTKIPLAGSHGHLDATTDVTALWTIFSGRPRLELAVACAASGLVVVDEDVRSDGDDTRAALEASHGPLPHTPRVLSGAGDGSTHYYFRAPPGATFPAQLGPGLDLKSNGYVLLPPSQHRSGRSYAWDLGAMLSETPIAPAPAWILGRSKTRRPARPAIGAASDSFIAVAFKSAGLLGTEIDDRRIAVACPWSNEHTDGRGRGADSSTVLFAPTSDEKLGTFFCSHGHCSPRRTLAAVCALPETALAAAAERYPAALARLRVLASWEAA